MVDVTIYHNPRCSKSRQTLALLREQGREPKIIEYLQTPPGEDTLTDLISRLGISPIELIRQKEYQSLNLPDAENDNELISRMVAHPEIIQRPIVVCGEKAQIGRPPQNILEIL